MTASAHVLVFRPLIRILRERGDEVEITARDYAQTLQLLELHGLEATVVGRHGGRSRLGKARSLASRLRALRKWARPRDFDLALAHGSHELTMTARRLGIPSATTHDYEFATLQHHLGMRAATKVVVLDSIPSESLARFAEPFAQREPGNGRCRSAYGFPCVEFYYRIITVPSSPSFPLFWAPISEQGSGLPPFHPQHRHENTPVSSSCRP